MNATYGSKQSDQSRVIAWLAVLVVLFMFLVLDAGALAWSASLIGGRQLTAELLTIFIVIAGGAITVWKMKVS